jgi:hypothetical protein
MVMKISSEIQLSHAPWDRLHECDACVKYESPPYVPNYNDCVVKISHRGPFHVYAEPQSNDQLAIQKSGVLRSTLSVNGASMLHFDTVFCAWLLFTREVESPL